MTRYIPTPSPANLTGIDERKRAEDEGDAEALVYGRRIRPRDVYVSSTLDDELPPQGDAAAELAYQIPRIPDVVADGMINIPETGTDWAAEDLLSRLARTPLTFSDIPELPSLPHVTGFTPTGDPLVDEKLFARRLQSTLGTAERQELMRLLTFRANVRYARQEVAYDRWIEEQEGAQGRRSGAKESRDATRVDSDCESAGSMPSAPTVSDSSDYDSEDIFGHGSEE
ncbi:hypothetical protein C2E23DRAFT_901794 [Lenzites betulinus]|nr:hypothetical protein C2E23DRAFT_901794 [Lenzites betulinus]